MGFDMSEARYTNPSEFCPHPEYWNAWDGSSAEVEVSEFISSLVLAIQPEYVIETGTCLGQTTEVIGKALKKSGHGTCVSLEINKKRIAIARKRCKDLPVNIVEQSSIDFIPEQTIDFAFIDSLHKLRWKEFLNFLPYFKEHSIICFHDTAPQFENNYTKDLGDYANFIQLHTPRGLTICQIKPEIIQ